MKPTNIPLILGTFFGTIFVSLLTYVLVKTWNVQADMPVDPEVTFELPDVTTTYKVRDLPVSQESIVIPSTDQGEPSFSYDAKTGSVTLTSSPQDYQIALSSLPNLRGTTEPHQVLTPNYTLVPRYQSRVELYNKRLNIVHRSSLPILLKDGSRGTELELPPELLRNMIMPTSLDLSVPLGIDEPMLLGYILPRLTPKQKDYFSLNSTTSNVRSALFERLKLQTTPVVLGVDDGPTSSGEHAAKYIEVDISQQKLYFFASGQLAKTYTISTGLDYPTPVGEFHIMNKAPLAFSGIYNAWMPYWMAFEYANDVGAYLGFHEKAYTSLIKGKKIYSHDREIGDKLTGGCIALSASDAKDVYDHSDVGMLVRIVP
ncbi:L,D-transpeptidase [Candidatus Woesebacteria bacterium]|nr:L,D-transpeptidase [Candidatus Woesebacteria bacterium]